MENNNQEHNSQPYQQNPQNPQAAPGVHNPGYQQNPQNPQFQQAYRHTTQQPQNAYQHPQQPKQPQPQQQQHPQNPYQQQPYQQRPQQYQQPAYQPNSSPKQEMDGVAIASLITGIGSIVLSLLGFLFWILAIGAILLVIGIILGIVAVITGVIAMKKYPKQPSGVKNTNRNLSMGGLICGVIGLVLNIIILVGCSILTYGIIQGANNYTR